MKHLLFVALFFSCNFVDEVHFEVDPRLQWVVDEFYSEAELRSIYLNREDLVVRVGAIKNSADFSGGKVSFITVNQSFFENGYPDSLALQYIVFHEFGHYMGREHTNSYSIMNPNKYAGDYRNNKEARRILNDELFQ
jgi:hypothetical protein